MAWTMRGLRRGRMALAAVTVAVLAGCGGGDADGGGGIGLCTTDAKKVWLQQYFRGVNFTAPNYFWYSLSPNPDPAAYADEDLYFDALLFTGNATWPADRWSNHESTESFNRFFGDGNAMGYGLAVAGLEVRGQRNAPLYVRQVDPGSPAAAAGLVRGDEIVSIGNFTAPELIDQITADNFTVLSPTATGERVAVVVRRGGQIQPTLTLTAAVYGIVPVSGTSVLTTPQGRRMGYVFVRNMISQAHSSTTHESFESAFATFRAQGVTELALDLRYNGGGLVETGRLLASYIAGSVGSGQRYALLRWNDQLAASKNQSFNFSTPTNALGLRKVYVLAGERTCSASEQVINGLRGVGIDVVVVGDTTCGKPVGFLPVANNCGTTYSVVNFDSVNAQNSGDYYNGLAANCPVAENFQQPVGSNADPLLSAARLMADGSSCASVRGSEQPQALRTRPARGRTGADGERIGMMP